MNAHDRSRFDGLLARLANGPTSPWGSRLALATVALAFGCVALAGREVPLRWQLVAYLFGMGVVNLPFGGWEHVNNLRGRGGSVTSAYVAAYLALIGVFVAAFFAVPLAALALLFAVAMAKAGHADVRVLDAVVGTPHLRTRGRRLLAGAVRGGAVMVLPLVFWPGQFRMFTYLFAGVFGHDIAGAVPFGAASAVAGTAYTALTVLHLGLGYATAGGSEWAVDAGETLLLVAFFALVPAVVAVGVYFGFWYSPRQVLRERVAGDPAGDDAATAGRPGSDGSASVPGSGIDPVVPVGGLTLLVAAMAAFAALVPQPLAGATPLVGTVAFLTVFVTVVAFPHVVVGSWLDPERGIWHAGGRP